MIRLLDEDVCVSADQLRTATAVVDVPSVDVRNHKDKIRNVKVRVCSASVLVCSARLLVCSARDNSCQSREDTCETVSIFVCRGEGDGRTSVKRQDAEAPRRAEAFGGTPRSGAPSAESDRDVNPSIPAGLRLDPIRLMRRACVAGPSRRTPFGFAPLASLRLCVDGRRRLAHKNPDSPEQTETLSTRLTHEIPDTPGLPIPRLISA